MHHPPARRNAYLVIIGGGGEDRQHAMQILSRFVELAGGIDARIVVITAASQVADEIWRIDDTAFGFLAVRRRSYLEMRSRADANNPHLVRQVAAADGIFMSGGDQKRLLALIGGTALDAEMHAALKRRGATIGGNSGGASAMSGHMLAHGRADRLPEKGAVSLGVGLGLPQRVMRDQHFSVRQRLSRLLSIVAQPPPCLHGIGIDENTAPMIERGVGIDVLSEGAVTVVDGRSMSTNVADIKDRATPELINVRLHLQPAGTRYALPLGEAQRGRSIPAPLLEFLQIITKPTPMSP